MNPYSDRLALKVVNLRHQDGLFRQVQQEQVIRSAKLTLLLQLQVKSTAASIFTLIVIMFRFYNSFLVTK